MFPVKQQIVVSAFASIMFYIVWWGVENVSGASWEMITEYSLDMVLANVIWLLIYTLDSTI